MSLNRVRPFPRTVGSTPSWYSSIKLSFAKVTIMLGLPTTQTALHFGANDVDGTITDGGELTHSYSVEEGGEAKMSKAELIAMIKNAGFEAVERDTVYNRIDRVLQA